MKRVLTKNYKEIMLLVALLGVIGCYTYGQIQKAQITKKHVIERMK